MFRNCIHIAMLRHSLLHRHTFFLASLLCLQNLTSGLHIKAKEGNYTVPYPDVVIVSNPDSGSRGLKIALERLGLPFGPEIYTGDDMISKPMLSKIPDLIRDGYARDSSSFRDAVNHEKFVSAANVDAIVEYNERKNSIDVVKPDVKWARKEPNYIFLLPILDESNHNRSKILAIARDPRDLCNAPVMKDSYREMYFRVMGRKDRTNLNPGWNETTADCYQSWAYLWSTVLDGYKSDSRLVVVRIEDLIMAEPIVHGPSYEAMRCVAKHIGLQPSAEAIIEALRNMHSHSQSYMGQGRYAKKQDMENALSLRTRPAMIHETMQRLGYHPNHYKLTTPHFSRVCGATLTS